jgi:hypothetical protein
MYLIRHPINFHISEIGGGESVVTHIPAMAVDMGPCDDG